jgi:hypothetical protein
MCLHANDHLCAPGYLDLTRLTRFRYAGKLNAED